MLNSIYFPCIWNGEGNAFGYSVHQKNILKALINQGVKFDYNADIALQIMPLNHYKPIPGKKNVVYTMYEFETLHKYWIKKLKDIDLLIVPSGHNKELFEKYTDKPVKVCLEGVDTDFYKYKKREFKSPFRFLWFGANNPRKGWPSLLMAWDYITHTFPEMESKIELYIKSPSNFGIGSLNKYSNIIVDQNIISNNELLGLYYSSNAFIFPTIGEGFGLTLVEALSTGLPAIWTAHTGIMDYLTEKDGYPTRWVRGKAKTYEVNLKSKKLRKKYMWTPCALCVMESLIENIINLYNNYDVALGRAANISNKIHRSLSWDDSARNLIKILQEV
jgi:glycosyltransferase involved in cell wall biosynthesis